MKELTSHEHSCELEATLDFVNTLELEKGVPVDHIESTRDATAWLQDHGLLHEWRLDGEPGPPELRRIRRARAALRELADATIEQRMPSEAALREVNRLLRAREILELTPAEGGLVLDHRHVGDPIDNALALLAEPLVHEIVGGRPERFRTCDDEMCRWIFFDDSRTGRRRWCDMATCGNRAKAARHRARVKAAEPTLPQMPSLVLVDTSSGQHATH